MKSEERSRKTPGQMLDTARQRAGLSLRQLEAITNIPRSTIDRILKDEVDNPLPEHLVTLADAVELNSTDVFIAAGLPIPTDLPSLEPYLRTKYDLPPEALAEARKSLEQILEKYNKDAEE